MLDLRSEPKLNVGLQYFSVEQYRMASGISESQIILRLSALSLESIKTILHITIELQHSGYTTISQ